MSKALHPRHVWRWVRRAPARHEEQWRERLAAFSRDLVIHERPGANRIQLEIYGSSQAPLQNVAREFGGKVERLDAHRIIARANAPRRPLIIAPDFAVLDAHGVWPRGKSRPRVLLRIGGAMAFGTGEHATTAACLRFLRCEASRLDSGWTALDIGTGTGILAITAEKLGAVRIEAFDHDPHAVRAAKANARRNRCSRVRIAEKDLLRWNPGRVRHAVVTANVFSEIILAASRNIARAVAPGGCLVLSGLLRTQEDEVSREFVRRGLIPEQVSRRGKWCTLQMRASLR